MKTPDPLPALAFALCLLALVNPLSAQATRRLELVPGGAEPDASITPRGTAGNGRYVLFESAASNLVPEDTNGAIDIFVHDLACGTTERISVSSAGLQANAESRRPTISADGRFVAFDSQARNLVPDDTNGDVDIFLFDRKLRTTTRVNLNNAGNQARRDSAWGSVSNDGLHVAFDSQARNLTVDDSNTQNDVFVRDIVRGRTIRITRPASGTVNGGSFFPRMSGNGRFVVFHSIASNLVAGDGNADWDVFIHDRDPDENGIFDEDNGETSLLSVGSGGQQGNRASRDAGISPDGRHASFWSESNNLVGGDSNDSLDVFVRDLVAGTTVRVSVGSTGLQGNGESRNVGLSADGRFVSFRSVSDNLVPGDGNGERDLFIHDRDPDENGVFDEGHGRIRRASLSSFDQEGDGDHTSPGLSADGRFLFFRSTSRNFRGSPTTGEGLYVRDLIQLRAERGLARGSWGFTVENAFGQEGQTVWILLSCTPTKIGTDSGGRLWLPLALDRCTSTVVLRATLDANGRAVIPPTRIAPIVLSVPVSAAALIPFPDATGVWSVSPPVALRADPGSRLRYDANRKGPIEFAPARRVIPRSQPRRDLSELGSDFRCLERVDTHRRCWPGRALLQVRPRCGG